MKLSLILSLGTLLIAWVVAIYSRSSGAPQTSRRKCYHCEAPLEDLMQGIICGKCRKGVAK